MTKDLNPKEYKQMMEYLTRKKPEQPKKEETIRNPVPVPQTRLKPLIDLEKFIEENPDELVTGRGKQTEALINTTNKHIKDQIKKGNIKKEDLMLKADNNGLMTNKNRTIAMRDSFMARQFNKALGIYDEPEATPEQVGKLAERLERSRQMTGKASKLSDVKKNFNKPFTKIANNLGKKKITNPLEPIKLDFSPLPNKLYKPEPPNPEMQQLERQFNEMVRKDQEEKIKNATSGLAGIIEGRNIFKD